MTLFCFQKKHINDFYRLSIIDQSTKGRQPMLSQSGRYTMVFNGEIYNAKKLRKKYLIKLNLEAHQILRF